MKQLRLVILILLAFLLPVRGAVAAAMLCPAGEDATAAAVAVGHGQHDRHVHDDPGMHADRSAAHTDAGTDAPGGESAAGTHSNTCHFCASGCCVTPLGAAPSTVASPLVTASVTFPALRAPVPVFHSDGQDRPPRTP